MIPARAGARAGSYLVDLAAVTAVGAISWPLARSWVVLAVVVVEAAVVLSLSRARTGRTPGGLLTRTIGLADGTDHAPGLGRQSVRSLVLGVLHLTVVGPLVTVATARDGRDWVDRIAGTAVADLRPRPARVAPVDAPYGRRTAAVLEPDASGSGAQPLPATGLWVVLDAGTRVELDAVLVLGRDPEATAPGERVVTVPDPGRSLSRTHLRIGADAAGAWVEDAFSANGTSCRTPDGRTTPVPRGRRISVPAGTTVLMGDRSLTIQAGAS